MAAHQDKTPFFPPCFVTCLVVLYDAMHETYLRRWFKESFSTLIVSRMFEYMKVFRTVWLNINRKVKYNLSFKILSLKIFWKRSTYISLISHAFKHVMVKSCAFLLVAFWEGFLYPHKKLLMFNHLRHVLHVGSDKKQECVRVHLWEIVDLCLFHRCYYAY